MGFYMKLIYLLAALTLTGLMMTTATANTEVIKIRSLFNIKNSFCTIKTNGVIGMDNRNSAYHGRGGGISSTNSLLFLENGENEVSLEIGALGWFSKENISDNAKENFNPLSSCHLDLIKFEKNAQIKLASIHVDINKNGHPMSYSSSGAESGGTLVLAEQAEPGHIDMRYFRERYFPKGMKVYKFSKKVSVSGIPDWKWTSASVFTGGDEQLKKLKIAYIEIAEMIDKQKINELKKTHSISLEAWSKTTGDSEDEIFESQYPKEDIEVRKIKIDPIEWNDYSVRVMNNGRIVQLYNKSQPEYSPLSYHSIDEDGDNVMGYFSPMFSLIDGKFVVVI